MLQGASTPEGERAHTPHTPHTPIHLTVQSSDTSDEVQVYSDSSFSNKEHHHPTHKHPTHSHAHMDHRHTLHMTPHPHKRVRTRHLVDREPGARKEFHQKLFKTPKEVVEAVIAAAEKKVALTLDKTIVLGFMAGIYVGFGGFFALSVSQNLPNVDPGFVKLILGMLFAFALLLIIFMGGELFTGNTMYLTVGLLSRKIKPKQAALNLVVVYFSNWAGCVFVAYFFGYLTELYAVDPYHKNLLSLAAHKLEMKPYVTFLRAIPANWLVCVAIFFNQTAEDVGGKVIGMVYAVACFAAVGFEHCIANMFYVDLALMYGLEHSFGEFLGYNLILVTIGNIIGGAFFVGVVSYYIYMTGTPTEQTDTKLEQQQLSKKHAEAKLIRFTWAKKTQ